MAFRSASSNATAATTLVITAPAGIANNDILLVGATTDNNTATFTWPSGYTEVGLVASTADGMRLGVAYKKAASESGDYTVVASGVNTCIGGIMCFSGRDTTNFYHRNGSGSSSATNATPWTLTPGSFGGGNTAGTCDIAVFGASDVLNFVNAITGAPAATYTEAFDIENNHTLHIFGDYKDAVASGFNGVVAPTGASTANQAGWGIIVVALLEASAAAVVDDDAFYMPPRPQNFPDIVSLW